MVSEPVVDALDATIDKKVKDGPGLIETDDVHEILKDFRDDGPRIEAIKSPDNVYTLVDQPSSAY